MNIKLKRKEHMPDATLGELYIENYPHSPIYTLENPKRESDVDSCIPAGIYQCSPYSGTKYKDVYIVKDVPNRTAILIHWGNTEKDTLGCILLGNEIGEINGLPAVIHSKVCYEKFRAFVGQNDFTLEIED